MAALANTFYDQLKAGALDKGAKRLAILNMPGITNTPRFQMVLDSIAAASGGGTAGATARSQSEALFKTSSIDPYLLSHPLPSDRISALQELAGKSPAEAFENFCERAEAEWRWLYANN